MSSPALGVYLSSSMYWGVGPRGVGPYLRRESVGDHELGLTLTGPSTAVQGDSENQVLVLVERRR